MIRRLAIATAVLLVAGLVAVGVTLLPPSTHEAPVRPTETDEGAAETLDEQIERIAGVVERIRELEFDTVPETNTLAVDELADRVAEEVGSYTVEEAASDQRILAALGAVAPGADLRALIIRGYSEQVGGFYDPRTGELVVGVEDPDERLGRLEEMILAHELQHALADAVLGLPEFEEVPEGEEDRVLASQALVEGDATVTMQRYLEVGFSVVDQLLLPGELARLEEQLAGFTELPHYVQRSFTFPYEEGAAFVEHLLAAGGWQAVDAAYARPPTTTAEIIFPDRYPAGSPDPPSSTAPAVEGWTSERSSAFGAADLLFLFEAPGNDPAAALQDRLAAVSAWRSGKLELHTSGEASAVSIIVGTDGSPTLCGAIQDWYDHAHRDDTQETSESGARWRGGTWSAVLACEDDAVALGIGPTLELAAAFTGR